MSELLLDEGLGNSKPLDNNKDIAEANKLRVAINESTSEVRVARIVLLVMSALQIFSSIVGASRYPEAAGDIIIEASIVVTIYVISFFLAKSKPKAGIMIGLGSYLGLVALYAYIDYYTLIQGFLVKIIVLYYLGRGLLGALSLEKKLDQLKLIQYTKEDQALVEKYKELPKIPYLKPGQ